MSEQNPYDALRGLTYALFRSNIDWQDAARNCDDPECHGDCRYIATIRAAVREFDGGILPDRNGRKDWADDEDLLRQLRERRLDASFVAAAREALG